MKPIPLPLHFKLPGRSYNQIGRKGNIALYSVYSDYFILPGYALPYILIGFELIAIKVRDGKERYAYPSEFGKSAWSIPKSWSRVCSLGSRFSLLVCSLFRSPAPETAVDRSSTPEASADLAQCAA